jgi:hypothetical protein
MALTMNPPGLCRVTVSGHCVGSWSAVADLKGDFGLPRAKPRRFDRVSYGLPTVQEGEESVTRFVAPGVPCGRDAAPTKAAGVLEFQKLLHLLQCLVQRQLKGAASWPRAGEAQFVLQPAIDHLQIGPAQHLLAP